jgi:hypothetical protein
MVYLGLAVRDHTRAIGAAYVTRKAPARRVVNGLPLKFRLRSADKWVAGYV